MAEVGSKREAKPNVWGIRDLLLVLCSPNSMRACLHCIYSQQPYLLNWLLIRLQILNCNPSAIQHITKMHLIIHLGGGKTHFAGAKGYVTISIQKEWSRNATTVQWEEMHKSCMPNTTGPWVVPVNANVWLNTDSNLQNKQLLAASRHLSSFCEARRENTSTVHG